MAILNINKLIKTFGNNPEEIIVGLVLCFLGIVLFYSGLTHFNKNFLQQFIVLILGGSFIILGWGKLILLYLRKDKQEEVKPEKKKEIKN